MLIAGGAGLPPLHKFAARLLRYLLHRLAALAESRESRNPAFAMANYYHRCAWTKGISLLLQNGDLAADSLHEANDGRFSSLAHMIRQASRDDERRQCA